MAIAEDMDMSDDNSDWSDPDEVITVRSDVQLQEADGEGEEEIFEESADADPAITDDTEIIDLRPMVNVSAKQRNPSVKLKIRTISGVRGIDFFCRSSIEVWSVDKVRAWVQRYQNPNGYYYRLTGTLSPTWVATTSDLRLQILD